MIGTSRQNLTNKLNQDNFSEQELIETAIALECKFEGFFIFDNGDKIISFKFELLIFLYIPRNPH
jgi:hypothetical protein